MINGPEELKIILEKNEKFLKNEINASDIELKQSTKFDAELNTKLNDWQIWLGTRKIKIIALIINDFESSYSCQTSYLIVSQRRNNKT